MNNYSSNKSFVTFAANDLISLLYTAFFEIS